MRQQILNSWLVAALIALVCLLGVTAYAAVKDDLPRTACLHIEKERQGACRDMRALQPGALRGHDASA